MAKKLFTVISFFPGNDARKPCKYRNVSSLEHYAAFAKKTGFLYTNVYDKQTREYIERRYHNE